MPASRRTTVDPSFPNTRYFGIHFYDKDGVDLGGFISTTNGTMSVVEKEKWVAYELPCCQGLPKENPLSQAVRGEVIEYGCDGGVIERGLNNA